MVEWGQAETIWQIFLVCNLNVSGVTTCFGELSEWPPWLQAGRLQTCDLLGRFLRCLNQINYPQLAELQEKDSLGSHCFQGRKVGEKLEMLICSKHHEHKEYWKFLWTSYSSEILILIACIHTNKTERKLSLIWQRFPWSLFE